ncbi:hypothetical protein [Clostridium sp. Marseille-P2415]|uniref:hypothetical protein n=1 Tax=Clostridium sp. Marseille-P2415 TaxID=1805471 RepID=UPI0009885E86|nr:hypothetical protein [Clostridium sp. Marseille-P2415]
MARGVRKTNREKLEEKLAEVRASIAQYKECLKTLEIQEKDLIEELEQEDLKELSNLLKECSMSAEDVKQMVLEYSSAERGA